MDSSKKNQKRTHEEERGQTTFWQSLYNIWMVIYGVIKVSFGAVATVALICLICLFVFVNIVAGYLEKDIMPNADISLGDHDVELNSYLCHVSEDLCYS